MIDVRAALITGVNGFFIAAGFMVCAITAFCAFALIVGLLGWVAKSGKGGTED